jgi:MerR HTH family regulatory protein
MPRQPQADGAFSRSGGGVIPVWPRRGDGLLTASAAASMVGVTPRTIRIWRDRELLGVAGRNERGWELFDRRAVRKAEMLAREQGMEALGTDPRKLRKPKPRARAAA